MYDHFILQDYAVKKWIMGGMSADKINLGLSFYGRTWMRGSSCSINTPGEGAGPAGDYTQEPGSLAYFEVNIHSICKI